MLRGALKRAFRTSERAEKRLLGALATKLDELARLLDGRRYLVGDTFSAADMWMGENVLAIDTGAGKGGFLTVVELPSVTVYESREKGAP